MKLINIIFDTRVDFLLFVFLTLYSQCGLLDLHKGDSWVSRNHRNFYLLETVLFL